MDFNIHSSRAAFQQKVDRLRANIQQRMSRSRSHSPQQHAMAPETQQYGDGFQLPRDDQPYTRSLLRPHNSPSPRHPSVDSAHRGSSSAGQALSSMGPSASPLSGSVHTLSAPRNYDTWHGKTPQRCPEGLVIADDALPPPPSWNRTPPPQKAPRAAAAPMMGISPQSGMRQQRSSSSPPAAVYPDAQPTHIRAPSYNHQPQYTVSHHSERRSLPPPWAESSEQGVAPQLVPLAPHTTSPWDIPAGAAQQPSSMDRSRSYEPAVQPQHHRVAHSHHDHFAVDDGHHSMQHAGYADTRMSPTHGDHAVYPPPLSRSHSRHTEGSFVRDNQQASHPRMRSSSARSTEETDELRAQRRAIVMQRRMLEEALHGARPQQWAKSLRGAPSSDEPQQRPQKNVTPRRATPSTARQPKRTPGRRAETSRSPQHRRRQHTNLDPQRMAAQYLSKAPPPPAQKAVAAKGRPANQQQQTQRTSQSKAHTSTADRVVAAATKREKSDAKHGFALKSPAVVARQAQQRRQDEAMCHTPGAHQHAYGPTGSPPSAQRTRPQLDHQTSPVSPSTALSGPGGHSGLNYNRHRDPMVPAGRQYLAPADTSCQSHCCECHMSRSRSQDTKDASTSPIRVLEKSPPRMNTNQAPYEPMYSSPNRASPPRHQVASPDASPKPLFSQSVAATRKAVQSVLARRSASRSPPMMQSTPPRQPERHVAQEGAAASGNAAKDRAAVKGLSPYQLPIEYRLPPASYEAPVAPAPYAPTAAAKSRSPVAEASVRAGSMSPQSPVHRPRSLSRGREAAVKEESRRSPVREDPSVMDMDTLMGRIQAMRRAMYA